MTQQDYDPVNPPHYQTGPVACIELVRAIDDYRLAQALRYIYRVAYGGKNGEDPKVDVRKAIWYLQDYIEHDKTGDSNALPAGIMARMYDVVAGSDQQLKGDS